jgi:hypothetical protein
MRLNFSPHEFTQKYSGSIGKAISWKRLDNHAATQLGNSLMRITCLSGRIWLTQEDEQDDTILTAGETCQLSGPGLVVAQGLPSALLKITRL